jgi:hypothetical protein
MRWWLREPVCRASFLLVAAYLARDRDVKLRVYPGIAPMLVWPVIMMLQSRAPGQPEFFSGFTIALTGVLIGTVPLIALDLLRYSQHWQAADLFHAAPMKGPGALCRGARRAVTFFLTLPVLVVSVLLLWLAGGAGPRLALLLPGIIALPLYGMLASLGGRAVPLSLPGEEAKSAGRGFKMFGVMMISMVLAAAATVCWSLGWFWWLMLGELICVSALFFGFRAAVAQTRWESLE